MSNKCLEMSCSDASVHFGITSKVVVWVLGNEHEYDAMLSLDGRRFGISAHKSYIYDFLSEINNKHQIGAIQEHRGAFSKYDLNVISGIDNEYALNAYLLFHSHACSFDLKLYNADFFSRIDTQNELNKIALELDEYLTSEEGCNIVGNSTQEYAIES